MRVFVYLVLALTHSVHSLVGWRLPWFSSIDNTKIPMTRYQWHRVDPNEPGHLVKTAQVESASANALNVDPNNRSNQIIPKKNGFKPVIQTTISNRRAWAWLPSRFPGKYGNIKAHQIFHLFVLSGASPIPSERFCRFSTIPGRPVLPRIHFLSKVDLNGFGHLKTRLAASDEQLGSWWECLDLEMTWTPPCHGIVPGIGICPHT